MIFPVYDMLVGVNNFKKHIGNKKNKLLFYDAALDIFKNSGHKMLKTKGFVSSTRNMATLWGDAIMQHK